MTKKKKSIDENQLDIYLWSDENILWKNRPPKNWFQYARHTPSEWDGNTNVDSNDLKYEGTFACSVYLATIIALIFLAIVMIPFLNRFFPNPSKPIFDLPAVLCLFIFVLILIALPLSYIFNKYIFRTDVLAGDIWYAITNQRIYWAFGEDYRFILLPNLEQVTLRLSGEQEVIEWHGKPISTDHDPWGNQIEKITFIVEDAESLIQIVQDTRNIVLPIEDLRQETKSKKAN